VRRRIDFSPPTLIFASPSSGGPQSRDGKMFAGYPQIGRWSDCWLSLPARTTYRNRKAVHKPSCDSV
jgi:hypothetical protein